MIGKVWREFRLFLIAGILLPVVAYISGASDATLGWLSAMFLLMTWLLLFKFARINRAGTEPQATNLTVEMNSLVQQMVQSATDTTGQVRAELAQVKSLLSDAVVTLLDSFSGLNRESRGQNTMILSVLEDLHRDRSQHGSDVAFHDFVSEMDQALHLFVEHIQEISEQSTAMVEQIDQIVKHLDKASDLLVDVKGAADQTKMLTLSAANEVAQADGAGRRFAVVADEVTVLSQRSNQFNQEIGAVLKDTRENIHKVRQSASRFSAKDLSFALDSRVQVDAMLQELGDINDVIGSRLKEASDVTRRIDNMASDAVRSLQFEDIVRQLTESSERHLGRLEQMLTTVAAGMQELKAIEPVVPGSVVVLHKLTLQINQIQSGAGGEEKTVQQSSMGGGGVDLL